MRGQARGGLECVRSRGTWSVFVRIHGGQIQNASDTQRVPFIGRQRVLTREVSRTRGVRYGVLHVHWCRRRNKTWQGKSFPRLFTCVGDVSRSHDASDLFHRLQVWGKPPVAAENLFIHNRSDRQAVKVVCERFPKLDIVPSFACGTTESTPQATSPASDTSPSKYKRPIANSTIGAQ
jgi:hypothetical protein